MFVAYAFITAVLQRQWCLHQLLLRLVICTIGACHDSYWIGVRVLLCVGGNQRETDRLRAEARNSKKGTGERKEGNPKSRNETSSVDWAPYA